MIDISKQQDFQLKHSSPIFSLLLDIASFSVTAKGHYFHRENIKPIAFFPEVCTNLCN